MIKLTFDSMAEFMNFAYEYKRLTNGMGTLSGSKPRICSIDEGIIVAEFDYDPELWDKL